MTTWVLPALYALFLWWFSTLVVLYLNGLSRPAARRSFHLGTGVAVLAVVALLLTREAVGPLAVGVAFTAGLLLWGWHELSYYAGAITGPSSAPCPPGATTWRRFRGGVRTCLYHELAVIATGAGLAVLAAGSANTVGFWTFTILWLMRWSAKLNIFLGVRNLHEEFWPEHLHYLASYTRRRSMNPLFPVSVAGAGIVLVLLLATAGGIADPGETTGLVLLSTLLALALVEHALLMLPISDDCLWRWGMRSRSQRAGPALPRGPAPEPIESA